MLDLDESGDVDARAHVLSSIEIFVDQFNDEVHVAFLRIELHDQIPSRLDGSPCG